MPVQVQQLACPKCNSPLDLKNAGRSKSMVCPSCGSQIDLTSPEYQIIGNVGQRPAPQATQFQVGMQGMLEGQSFQIIGRVVYHDDEGDIWDEWLLLSAQGEYVWISDSVNEGMALWRGFVPPEPVEPAKLSEGDTVTLRGEKIRVRDAGSARIDYLEGELTWKAAVGSTMNYIEADSPRQRISIEFTENEVEFYGGGRVDAAATAKAFGATRSGIDAGQVRTLGKVSKAISTAGCLGIFLCIALMCFAVTFLGDSTSASLVCITPNPAVIGTLVPGAPTPEPICYTPTPGPASAGGFIFGPSSGGGSMRSGSSGGRSTGGGGGSSGGGK